MKTKPLPSSASAEDQKASLGSPSQTCCVSLLESIERIRRMCKTVAMNPNYARIDIAETIERQCTEAISKHNADVELPRERKSQ